MEKFTWKCVKALFLKYFYLVFVQLYIAKVPIGSGENFPDPVKIFRIRWKFSGSSENFPDPVKIFRIQIQPKRSGSDRIRIRNPVGTLHGTWFSARTRGPGCPGRCSWWCRPWDPPPSGTWAAAPRAQWWSRAECVTSLLLFRTRIHNFKVRCCPTTANRGRNWF